MGVISLENKRYRDAFYYFNTTLRFSPKDKDAYYNMGVTCMLLNDFEAGCYSLNEGASLASQECISLLEKKCKGVTLANRNELVKNIMNFDQKPEYPGGEKALGNFINSTIKYPITARRDNVEGPVHIIFLLNEQGKVVSPVISLGINEALNNEALSLVYKLKDFKPAMKNGQPLSCIVAFPINFRLR